MLARIKNFLKDVIYYQNTNFEKPGHLILIGTHHKTGSFWLYNIFKDISFRFGMNFHAGDQSQMSERTDILFNGHSQFDLRSLSNYRGLHLIRDPRDMIISATFYHMKSDEPWLHRPMDKFDGMSYQEKLNSYNNLDDQILFEMEGSSYANIQAMANWDYQNSNFINIKYEELIEDIDLKIFHEIMIFLGLTGPLLTPSLEYAYRNSVFSQSFKDKGNHISKRSDKKWNKYFKHKHIEKFNELHSGIFSKIGYEAFD